MAKSTEYASRSRSVRSEARAYLQSLKAERAARRRTSEQPAPSEAAPEPAPFIEAVIETAVETVAEALDDGIRSSDRAMALAQAASAAAEQAGSEAVAASVEVIAEVEGVVASAETMMTTGADDIPHDETPSAETYGASTDAEPEASPEGPSFTAVDPASQEDPLPQEDASPVNDVEVVAAAAVDVAGLFDATAVDRATLEASDLVALPNIKPGLVWALAAAGAPSLSALAAADAAALRERLGLIGQLVDLDGWIDIARAKTGGETASGDHTAE
ncbi:MAG: hypothetical protein AAF909_08910 [Pseudomonadota bacterium]